MGPDASILIPTAVAIAVTHTLLGPDHYLPFIAMGRAGGWSAARTSRVALFCGLGHVVGSVALALLGMLAGISLNRFVAIESGRESLAAWMLIAFGLVYLAMGLRHALAKRAKRVSGAAAGALSKGPCMLFFIFLFGPCEPLVPLLLYPAASGNAWLVLGSALIFSVATLITMLLAVLAGLKGASLLPAFKLQPFGHALAGLVICASGIAIRLLAI